MIGLNYEIISSVILEKHNSLEYKFRPYLLYNFACNIDD